MYGSWLAGYGIDKDSNGIRTQATRKRDLLKNWCGVAG